MTQELEQAPRGYLLRITKGTQVIAEAPLYIYDDEAASKAFLDAFPGIIGNVAGGVLATLLTALDPERLAATGGNGLVAMSFVIPSPLEVAGNITPIRR